MSARRMARDEFLARVRRGLGRGSKITAPPTAPAPDPSLLRLQAVDDPDLMGAFCREAEARGMHVHRCAAAEARTALDGLLRRLQPQRVAVAARKAVASWWEASLAGVARAPHGCGNGPLFDCDLGLTDVAAAIAETGTLVYRSGPEHGRGVFLVPPVHLALVTASDLVADSIDWCGGPAGAVPAGEVWITGPSKTADIEGVLVTGVHGPRVVHVLAVDGEIRA